MALHVSRSMVSMLRPTPHVVGSEKTDYRLQMTVCPEFLRFDIPPTNKKGTGFRPYPKEITPLFTSVPELALFVACPVP
jgi:hypothetical protein